MPIGKHSTAIDRVDRAQPSFVSRTGYVACGDEVLRAMPLLPFWACAGYTAVYVGSIYVLPKVYAWFFPGRQMAEKRKRNEPSVIRERLWSVSVATFLNLLGTACVVRTNNSIQSKVC